MSLPHERKTSFQDEMEALLREIRAEGRFRELRRSEGLSFTHNDYLGLAGDPTVVEAGCRALSIFGAGSRGSRLLGGHSLLFEDVEEKIAAFFKAPAALFFSTGYLANLAGIQALGSVADAIVSDERVHASLIDGIRLVKKPRHIVPHQGWDQIPKALAEKSRLLLIAESLYSMDGDTVDEAKLLSAWRSSESFLFLDEAHAAGVFGADGRGLSAKWRDWDRMAMAVTFGKAFGTQGAAILCSQTVKDLLVNTARAFIYTTAPSPAIVAMAGAAVDVVEASEDRRLELWDRALFTRSILREGGCPIPAPGSYFDERSPIIPFFLPGEDRALRFSENMRESGVELRAIRYPTVAKGTERVRVSLNLTVSRENTEAMAKEMVRRWKQEMAYSS